ncbi:MAG: YfiR family protein [Planctomycetes bacterium]|nr:YfiR family protein [Planctomycetota bacterium]
MKLKNLIVKNKVYILLLILILAAVSSVIADTKTGAAASREYRIKAAFLYNFIKFIDWPQEKMPDNDEPIIIGIVESEDFIKAFDPIKNKKVKGKKVILRKFDKLGEMDENKDQSQWRHKIAALKECHILFFCHFANKKTQNQIIKDLSGFSVLTVGQADGFLESGGNINFIKERQKVRFEINLKTSKQNELKIKSRFLKLAIRVIK